ncbi:MAG TPA: alpha/beta fold hydrolase [Thermoleophilaceae bacterium]
MTRRGALWLLFAISAALFAVLSAIDLRMWDEGGPGIVGFEVAWSADGADRILTEWGDAGRDAARLSLWLDFLFLAAYGAFWALAARPNRLWVLAPVAAGFDALENVALLVQLGGSGGSAWPVLAGIFATLKFLALAVVIGVVVVRIVLRFPRYAAVAVSAVLLLLAVNTWTVERQTRPADPDIGQLVRLSENLQVRVDGPAGAPAVVLVHGFGASMRWWDGVTPALARSLRVVRIDLLGHGGSEKPRDGYSMENQADLVAEAIAELKLGRVAVVGHSMGGMVATALAERHRSLVSRVMLIGTPVDGEGGGGGLLGRAAFWPVIGQLNERTIGEDLVRWAVEHGFAPEFDPPRRLVRDVFQRTTWRAFKGSADAISGYLDEEPLDSRLRRTGVPVTVVLGQQEGHANRSLGRYNRVPRARTVLMEGLDHSPMVESPARTTPLIEAFAHGR